MKKTAKAITKKVAGGKTFRSGAPIGKGRISKKYVQALHEVKASAEVTELAEQHEASG